ncbi:hypothetical protein JCM10449v2_006208 [Rhodotorula kratochvilovae]
MATPPRLPLLPPPPPQFPTRFTNGDTPVEPPQVQAEWPEGRAEAGGEDLHPSGEVEWGLKTEREEHLDRLESRLAQLRASADPSPSLFVNPADPPAAFFVEELSDVDEDTTEPADEAEGAAAGDDADEGRALLSAVGAPSGHDQASQQARTTSDDEGGLPPNAVVIDAATLDEVAQLPPHLAQAALQRISFGNTVRISGGMRSSSRPHRHRHAEAFAPPPPNERTSLLSSQPRPISAPSDLLVAAVTPSAGPSRSTSPAPSRGRRPSISSSYLSASSFAHLHASSYPVSSSPTSYGASRSSSPCSSIYAPLQPPSKYCPNPLWVRTTAQRGLRRSRSGGSLSFQDFLRSGAAYAAYDDDDDDDSDEDDLVAAAFDNEADARGRRFGPSRAEYRDLVAAQQARRARWEARRAAKEARARADAQVAKGPRFWDRVAGLLALGMVGAGPARAGGLGGSTHAGVGALRGGGEERGGRGAGRGRGRSPARPSPLARQVGRPPSMLAVESSVESLSSDGASDASDLPAQRPSRPPRPPVVKTEADVRFGPAPARYFRLDWLRYKLAQLVTAARAALRTALVGWEQASAGRRREREEGYEAV